MSLSDIDRDLRRLPAPRAPQTLVPRVMAAIDRWSERPWHARAWLAWPAVWQAASLAAWIAIVAGMFALGPTVQENAVHTLTAAASNVRVRAAASFDAVLTAATAVRVVWRALVEPAAPYLFAIVMVMCLACALFAAALSQITSGRMVER